MRPAKVTGLGLFDLFAYGENGDEADHNVKSSKKRDYSKYNSLDKKNKREVNRDYNINDSHEVSYFPKKKKSLTKNTETGSRGQKPNRENPIIADNVEQNVELKFEMRNVLNLHSTDGNVQIKDSNNKDKFNYKDERHDANKKEKKDSFVKKEISEQEEELVDTSSTTKIDNNAQEGAGDSVSTAEVPKTQLLITHQIRHQVALPPHWDYKPINEHIPNPDSAFKYPFKLDPFQQTSINSIERNESVLVSAHTSAGKTVIAEYAIALSLKNKQRVIYTSPIKALSNQKYREFVQNFEDVGLMTGDVTINPGAGCVVMTTEILRSMLYKGSYIEREVAWIIFDEIHYMRDAHRGVVWEETIIMLPDTVRYIFLSATVPNAMQFAEWICKIHKQPCHVVYTDFRPTPLQHYIFPSGGDGIYLAVDEKGCFLEDNFQKAIKTLDTSSGNSSKNWNSNRDKFRSGDNSHGNQQSSCLLKIIKLVMRRNYYPIIVFSFSKRECEFNAKKLTRFDLNTNEQKEMVNYVFVNAISSLGEEEKKLPQIVGLLPLLQRGIGIHHSGLLPIIKEAIEILFQEGLIKVLFATETFSIGLNMPAKTVMFTSLRKWDGKENRWITSGEYIQMSGRAGRRGLDDRGIVILMLDEKIEPHVARSILKGSPDPFNSAFYLSYTMVLNLLRLELISPENMLERSFFQFQACARLPKVQEELEIYKSRLSALVIPNEDLVADYHGIKDKINEYENDIHEIYTHPTNCAKFLQPGRLVHVKLKNPTTNEFIDYGYGSILSFQKLNTKPEVEQNGAGTLGKHVLFVCIRCLPGSDVVCMDINSKTYKLPKPNLQLDNPGDVVVVAATLSCIYNFSAVLIPLKHDLKTEVGKKKMDRTIVNVLKDFPNGPELLDPIKDMGINDSKYLKISSRLEVLKKRFEEHELNNHPNKEECLEKYEIKLNLIEKIKSITKEVKMALSAVQLHELRHRRNVLKRLGYISAGNIIEMKGRVACEISACDELVVTEMIFDGIFNDLTVDQTVALLSCLTFQEKSNDSLKILEELEGPFRSLQEHARNIARISLECKIEIVEDEYVDSFRPELMEIAYAWSKGASFAQVCAIRTDIFEGSIIRALKRLEELLRQLIVAAKSIGNTNLENKFSDAIIKIKRDIVFAASLYL